MKIGCVRIGTLRAKRVKRERERERGVRALVVSRSGTLGNQIKAATQKRNRAVPSLTTYTIVAQTPIL